ncbi:MAG: MCP four helix bundle domain-containing protein [bacterium]|nr:MCP four helix bundle domain-containing protein [bacterium]
MEKSSWFKFFLITLPIFIFILLGMVWYNAKNSLRSEKDYAQLITSAGISSNALTQATINTSLAMHQCNLLVYSQSAANWEHIEQNLESIRKENTSLIENLKSEAKTEQQKEKLQELISVRAQLIDSRDSLLQMVKSNKSSEAKAYLLNSLAPNFSHFFSVGSAYLDIIQQNAIAIQNELSEKNKSVRKMNDYLFWLPIIYFGIFFTFLTFVLFRIFSKTKI